MKAHLLRSTQIAKTGQFPTVLLGKRICEGNFLDILRRLVVRLMFLAG